MGDWVTSRQESGAKRVTVRQRARGLIGGKGDSEAGIQGMK